ncbi:Clp protease N-terminal domain-containing protein [Cellulomonas endophytica]|uniref:Clp protease N-terminal domain-containing protein n=1 Tax=Cellulomonas endophytica TaxID=2494735 RepID=UPI0010110C34|nr:Clp protease N-terminal domain-containing protein [Cellulomonas endophytica]
MFERFTQEARDGVVGAQLVARERGDRRIGTEHVLLGALRAPGSVAATALGLVGRTAEDVAQAVDARSGIDAGALAGLGIDLEAVRRRAEAAFGPGALDVPADEARDRPVRGHVPFDRDAKKTLEVALREALALKHRHIDTGHVLLALARLDGTAAHTALAALGLGPDEVRRAVHAAWRGGGADGADLALAR